MRLWTDSEWFYRWGWLIVILLAGVVVGELVWLVR